MPSHGGPSHYFSSSVQVNGAVWALKAQSLFSPTQRHSPAHRGVLSILPMNLCLYPGQESSHGLPPYLTFLFRMVHKSTTPCQLCGVCLLGHPEPAQKESLLITAARCQRLLLLPCSDQQHSSLSPYIPHGIKATK